MVKLPGWIFRAAKLSFACVLLIASIRPSWASAQATDDPWAAPVNLSYSGAATNPDIVSDSEGFVHVVWQDDVGNYVYSRFDGDQWSLAETTDLNRSEERRVGKECRSRWSPDHEKKKKKRERKK